MNKQLFLSLFLFILPWEVIPVNPKETAIGFSQLNAGGAWGFI